MKEPASLKVSEYKKVTIYPTYKRQYAIYKNTILLQTLYKGQLASIFSFSIQGIDSTMCQKHSSQILFNIDMTASHKSC